MKIFFISLFIILLLIVAFIIFILNKKQKTFYENHKNLFDYAVGLLLMLSGIPLGLFFNELYNDSKERKKIIEQLTVVNIDIENSRKDIRYMLGSYGNPTTDKTGYFITNKYSAPAFLGTYLSDETFNRMISKNLLPILKDRHVDVTETIPHLMSRFYFLDSAYIVGYRCMDSILSNTQALLNAEISFFEDKIDTKELEVRIQQLDSIKRSTPPLSFSFEIPDSLVQRFNDAARNNPE